MASKQYFLTSSKQTVVANESIFTSEIHSNSAFQVFQDMRVKEELCDTYLCVGSQRFPAHRVILAGTCPLFREKLATSQDEIERTAQRYNELEIPENFNKSVVLNVLDFLYEGKLVLNMNQMSELLHLLSFLKIDEALTGCERFTIDHLRTQNCIEFLKLAETLNLEQLKQKAVEYLEWNFLQVVNEDDFVKLSAFQITSLLGSNNLKVKREDRVYDAVWKWYKHDPENRDQDLDVVLKTIRFRQISTKFLKTRVLPELVEGVGRCRSDVEEALTSRRLSQKINVPGTPRNSRKIIYLFSMKTNRVDTFDEEQRVCMPCPELASSDVGRDDNYRCAVIVQDELYVVFKMAVNRFNPVTRKWTWVGQGRSVREAGVCSDKHNIYVLGGKPDDLAAQKFDVRLGIWYSMPEMIRPRRCTGAVVLGRKIYVVGGLNDDGLLTTMERFHLRSQKWEELPGLQEPRFSMGVATWARSVFVFGGRSDRQSLKSMEVYYPKEERWVSAPAQLNDKRSEFGHVVHVNKIYCFGGRGVNSVECYDYLKQQWRIVGRVSDNTYSVNCLVFPPLN